MTGEDGLTTEEAVAIALKRDINAQIERIQQRLLSCPDADVPVICAAIERLKRRRDSI